MDEAITGVNIQWIQVVNENRILSSIETDTKNSEVQRNIEVYRNIF